MGNFGDDVAGAGSAVASLVLVLPLSENMVDVYTWSSRKSYTIKCAQRTRLDDKICIFVTQDSFRELLGASERVPTCAYLWTITSPTECTLQKTTVYEYK